MIPCVSELQSRRLSKMEHLVGNEVRRFFVLYVPPYVCRSRLNMGAAVVRVMAIL